MKTSGNEANGEKSWDAALYSQRHSFVFNLGQGVLELLNPRSGEYVLDIGCGTGQLTQQIAEAVGSSGRVVGVDSSEQMIESAQSNFPDLDFRKISVIDMPFEGEFDAAFSNAVLHWVPQVELAVENIARSLKPGGRFVAEFGGHRNVEAIVSCTLQSFAEAGAPEAAHSWYYPSIGEYAPILESHGLEVQQAQLFDRLTQLEGDDGMLNWLSMFGSAIKSDLAPEKRVDVYKRAVELMRPRLYKDGSWFADYRRIRVYARKVA